MSLVQRSIDPDWPITTRGQSGTAEADELTYPRDALYGNLPDSFLKTGEPRIHLPDLHLFPLDQLFDYLREEERDGD